jgi:molybdopterin synthase catalytic subunit
MSDGPVTVRVLFFAGARDATGVRECELPAANGSTIGDVARVLTERFPALAPHLRSLRFARNGEYVRNDEVIAAGDEIAVIPPVAGG